MSQLTALSPSVQYLQILLKRPNFDYCCLQLWMMFCYTSTKNVNDHNQSFDEVENNGNSKYLIHIE